MPRTVRYLELFWNDKDFKKALKSLPEPEKQKRLGELVDLTAALASATHATHDPSLAPWKPTAYHVRKVGPDVKLYEYRCRYPMRVIARWIEPSEREPEGSILFIAATLSHDHERLKEVIFRSREGLVGGEREE